MAFVVKLNKYCKGDERYGGDRNADNNKNIV